MSNKKELFEAKAIMKGYEDSLRKTKHQQSQITELKDLLKEACSLIRTEDLHESSYEFEFLNNPKLKEYGVVE